MYQTPVDEEEDRRYASDKERRKKEEQKARDVFREVASRYFAFSILQGLLENRKIMELPEPVNFIQPSKYVVHNYADTWLDDNRYGNLHDLNKRLQRRRMVGNKILIIQSLRESDKRAYSADRGRGERNRTHDCYVEDGLNTINFIDDEGIYVSVEKEWSGMMRPWHRGGGVAEKSRSNFLIKPYEYIDLTYFNSEWMKYFILTKKIGDMGTGGKNVNYAYMIQYLNIGLDYLRKREEEERAAIAAYYPDIDKVMDWPVLLSHWKLLNKVREITDYQAKRFAKYLAAGKVRYVKNLFGETYKPKSPDFRRFASTKVMGTCIGSNGANYWISNDDSPWGCRTPYGDRVFKLDVSDEELAEREKLDEQKLHDLLGQVRTMLDGLDYSLNDIVEAFGPRHLDMPKYYELMKFGFLNEDLSWNENERTLDKAIRMQTTGAFSYEKKTVDPEYVRFRRIAFFNTLLENIYPLVVQAVNYLEEERFEQEYIEAPR